MRNPGTVSPSRTNDPNVQDRGGICTPSLQELAKTAHQVDSHVRNINSETTNYHHAKAMAGENSVPIMEQTYSIAIQSGASVWAGGSLSREKDWKSLEHRRKTS